MKKELIKRIDGERSRTEIDGKERQERGERNRREDAQAPNEYSVM